MRQTKTGRSWKLLLVLLYCTALSLEAGDSRDWPAPAAGWKAPEPGEHPRLFFRKSNLEEIRKRAGTPEGKVILKRLRFLLNGSDGESMPTVFNVSAKAYAGNKAADDAATDSSKKGELPIGAYTLWHGAGFGMLYQLTQDKKYADFGKQCVEKAFSGVRDRDDRYSWIKPGGALRAGPSIGAIAMAYDLCYDGWDDAFRKKVASELQNYNQGPHMSLAEMAQGKRHGPHSNHWGCQIGGGALALLAINGDPGVDASKIQPLLESNARCVIQQLTRGFGDGGYFMEHAGPGQIGSDTAFIPAIQAWRIAGGKDFITPRPNVPAITLIRCFELLRHDNKTSYMLRHPSSYGTGHYPEDRIGLSRGGQFSQGFGAIPEEYKPGVLWVYNNIVEPDANERSFDTVSPYPHRAVLSLINWPFVAEKDPATVFPRVHHDSFNHYAVFRNRWHDGNDILVSGLWGARNDGAEPVMIWGLGESLNWLSCPKVKESRLSQVKADGSGVIKAGNTSLAVDFSKSSGAEALVVMIGAAPAKGTLSKNGKVKTNSVTAASVVFNITTLAANGQHPEPKVEGDELVVGEQRVSVKDGVLVLSK
jgi:hypothetical protein